MSSPSGSLEVAVVGAGVVGLAVAAELAEAGSSVIVIERHPGPGLETSSRNSEVIHAGLYYPTGSLKARLCVEGRHLLYAYCQAHGIGHRRLGKLVVAPSDSERPELERLLALGSANGAEGLRLLDRAELSRLEPAVRAGAALFSPETGIIDSHGLMKSLEARLHAAGGLTLYRCELIDVEPAAEHFVLRLRNPSGEERLVCRWLINSAGLESDRVAAMAGVSGYQLHWCKGDYCSVAGAPARSVSRLIYPVPQGGGLGIHVTLDLGGRMRLGPDATYIDRTADRSVLSVSEQKVPLFAATVQRYLPGIRAEHLQPEMAAIRPKLQGPSDSFKDFVIKSEAAAGLPQLVSLIGLESPGLTSCLAVGKLVHAIFSGKI